MSADRNLLEKLANLSNRLDASKENKKVVITGLVMRVVESFLSTTRGSVMGDSDYGMYDIFTITNMFSQDQGRLFTYIRTSLEKLDGRIASVKVGAGEHKDKKSQIPYIDIEIFLKKELFPDLTPGEVVKFNIGYDLLGNIYQVKEKW